MSKKLRILICPLNWGLGHATRCIPIINCLLESGFEVFLASDGRALSLLKEEYPKLPVFDLPGYDVRYEGSNMVWNIAKQLPKISIAILAEKKAIRKIVAAKKIDIIISDNRYGCRSKKTKNIFITHQINIAIPNKRLEIITNKINQHFINLFDECWIPDFEGKDNLAGKLSASDKSYQYLGPLSRFEYFNPNSAKSDGFEKKYKLIVVLSGPEPQRSILENTIIDQLKPLDIKALIIQGKTEREETKKLTKNITVVSFLTSKALNEAILKSEIVLARSGYSTIMDLVHLRKQAILVPTPGQTEQEYLAARLSKQNRFYSQTQNKLNIKKAIKASALFSGFSSTAPPAESLCNFLKSRMEKHQSSKNNP